jgi:hypothetical protein
MTVWPRLLVPRAVAVVETRPLALLAVLLLLLLLNKIAQGWSKSWAKFRHTRGGFPESFENLPTFRSQGCPDAVM